MLCLIFLDKKCCYDAGRDNDRDPEACVKRNRVAEEEVAEDCREDNRGVLKHRRHENILHAVGLRHAELSDGGRDAHAGEREEALHIDGGEAPVRDEVTDKAPECAERRVVEHDSPGRLVQFRELPDLKPHKSGEKSRAETDKSRFDLSGFSSISTTPAKPAMVAMISPQGIFACRLSTITNTKSAMKIGFV